MKSGGPLGLSIIGGNDHSCVPFGTGEPGIFISKVFYFDHITKQFISIPRRNDLLPTILPTNHFRLYQGALQLIPKNFAWVIVYYL